MDPIAIVAIATLATGFAGLLLRYGFRSKCSHVSLLWGCCDVTRDGAQENAEEQMQIKAVKNGVDISKIFEPNLDNKKSPIK